MHDIKAFKKICTQRKVDIKEKSNVYIGRTKRKYVTNLEGIFYIINK